MANTKKEVNYLEIYLKFMEENSLENISFIDSSVFDNTYNENEELSFKNIDKSVFSS